MTALRIILLAAMAAALCFTAAPAAAQSDCRTGVWHDGVCFSSVALATQYGYKAPAPIAVATIPYQPHRPRPPFVRPPHTQPRVIVIQPRGSRPHHQGHDFRGVYKPQPLKPPKQIRVGPPKCGDGGRFDPQLGLCVATEITRIDMPPEHKEYLANCPGTIETRTIFRDGVLVEQQRCVR